MKLTLELRPDLAEPNCSGGEVGTIRTHGVVDAVVVDRNHEPVSPTRNQRNCAYKTSSARRGACSGGLLERGKDFRLERWTQRQRIHRSGDARL